MRFGLAVHRLSSCNYFLPNQLAVGCRVMLLWSSPTFIWPSRSSAVLSLQHQKSQQTWAELAQETCAGNHSSLKEGKVKQWLFPYNWNRAFPWTESFQCPTFGRTEEKSANMKSFSSVTFIMKNLLFPLHPDQNILISAILWHWGYDHF